MLNSDDKSLFLKQDVWFFSFQDIYLVDIQICYFFLKFPSPVVYLYLFLIFTFWMNLPQFKNLKYF